MKCKSNLFLSTLLAGTLAMTTFVGSNSAVAFAQEDSNNVVERTAFRAGFAPRAFDGEVNHITARYEFRAFLSEYGLLITEIEDRTTNTPGYFGPLWENFKNDKGLSKYVGMTFDEIKNMQTPAPIVTMAGEDNTPEEVHLEILKHIDRLEKNSSIMEKLPKTELAKEMFHAKPIYDKRHSGEYTKESMNPFVVAYNLAQGVLNDEEAESGDISSALSAIKMAKEGLKIAPLDFTKLNAFITAANRILGEEDTYSLASVAMLKQKLADANNILNDESTTREILLRVQTELGKAIRGMVKKADQGSVYNINGKIVRDDDPSTISMANGFLNPVITLEVKDGVYTYLVGFKSGQVMGITSSIEYVKHIENGEEKLAPTLEGHGEYSKIVKIVRSQPDESQIRIKLAAQMSGPAPVEMPAILSLDLTSKRDEGVALGVANKTNLENTINAQKKTFDEVISKVYKPTGSAEYLKIYNEALQVLADATATQETVDTITNKLMQAKDLHLSLNKDSFATLIDRAEALNKDDYTKESSDKLKAAIDKANATFYKTTLEKEEMDAAIAELEAVLESLQNKVNEVLVDNTLVNNQNSIGVSLRAKLGESAVLNVVPIDVSALSGDKKAVLDSLGDVEHIAAFDISVRGSMELLNGNIHLTFKVGEAYNGKEIKLTHFKENGEVEKINQTVSEGNIEISTDSLSPFILSTDRADDSNGSNNTNNEDNTGTTGNSSEGNNNAGDAGNNSGGNDSSGNNASNGSTGSQLGENDKENDGNSNSKDNNTSINAGDEDGKSENNQKDENKLLDKNQNEKGEKANTKDKTAKTTPNTSDNRNVLFLAVLMLGSLLGFIGFRRFEK